MLKRVFIFKTKFIKNFARFPILWRHSFIFSIAFLSSSLILPCFARNIDRFWLSVNAWKSIINIKFSYQNLIGLKGTINLDWRATLHLKDHARFTTVPLKPLSEQNWWKYHNWSFIIVVSLWKWFTELTTFEMENRRCILNCC